MSHWNARRILKEIADRDLRRKVLSSFWKDADDHARGMALAQLATSVRFRPESLRKASHDRKVELLSTRLAASEFEETFEIALMLYHTTVARDLLAAFLERWGIPHENGSIETDDYQPPTEQKVEEALSDLEEELGLRPILLYLASAGLLMGTGTPEWREATWPVVDRHLGELAPNE